MEVQFTPDQQAKLAQMSLSQGRAQEALVQDSVDRFLRYEDWFLSEADKGIQAADHGQFMDHAAVGAMLSTQKRTLA
jgi:predicted transcriptional regulator